MAKPTKKLVARIDEYQKDGQWKAKHLELGIIFEGEKGEYGLLDINNNLAGILLSQNELAMKQAQRENKQYQRRSKVSFNIYPIDGGNQQQGQQHQPSFNQEYNQQAPPSQQNNNYNNGY